MGNKITIGLILITLGTLFYFNFVKEDVTVQNTLTVNTATSDILGKKIATALNKLNSLSLDTSIFNEPGYQALRPFHQEIFPLPAGKRSPFDPIDAEGFSQFNGGTGNINESDEELLDIEVNTEEETDDSEVVEEEETPATDPEV